MLLNEVRDMILVQWDLSKVSLVWLQQDVRHITGSWVEMRLGRESS